ncbi:MAG TPA: heavy metal translocating P-type ATPase, partial [Phycisphaerae bacterium]|nr:heavy metal translocating P-type ATPase [Phycisphaerae bacterium]
MMTEIFKIHGMDCAEEVKALKSELGSHSGVQELAFDVLNGKMTVTYSEAAVTPDELIAAVARTGMRAQPWRDLQETTQGESTFWSRRGRVLMTTASGAMLTLGFVAHVASRGWRAAFAGHETLPPPLACVLYLAAVAVGAWYVAPKGWLALKRLRPDMNLLMIVAIVGAILLGEYFEAATVAFLFALSLLLESWSVARVRRAVAALMAMTPPQARIVGKDGGERLVDVADVAVGRHVVVKPGEKIPLDGRIIQGTTNVNEAPITGESLPVAKSLGSEVFAGTINEDGAVVFETTKPASDTTLSRIIRMVSEAQNRRAPAEQWVEKFARVYTPAVMALAVLVALVPPLAFGGTWSKWFYEALVLLVIACPCALVISTPVSIVASLTAAARYGVLIKGGAYVELPARLRAVALDKTGTLTEGRPELQHVVPLAGHDEREVLEIAAAIESRSEHPLARAIVRHATAAGLQPAPVEGFQAIKGKGAGAILGGSPVWIGSHRLLEERGQETPEMHERLEAMSAVGSSVVVIGNDDHVCGLIAVGDRVRSNAKLTVTELKAAGIDRVVMLTGDNSETAAAVAFA